MALVWFVDKFPRSRKPVQYRRLDDIVSFFSAVDRLKTNQEPAPIENGHEQNRRRFGQVSYLLTFNKNYQLMSR